MDKNKCPIFIFQKNFPPKKTNIYTTRVVNLLPPFLKESPYFPSICRAPSLSIKN